ncbi:hypothetical protein GCM10028805_54220 [Spirosoma harenae]
MTQAEQIQQMLRLKPYRSLNSPRLKPTPDLTFTPPNPVTQQQEELHEAKLIFEYEQSLQQQKSQRGY